MVVRVRGAPLSTPVPIIHLWPSPVSVMFLGLWFYAIAHLPLDIVMTLKYMSSAWAAAFVVGGALLYGNTQRQGLLLVTYNTHWARVRWENAAWYP